MKHYFLCSLLIFSSILTVSAQTINSIENKLLGEPSNQDSCTYLTSGRNLFFILEPGYQLILEGSDGNVHSRLVITVLNETKRIGNVETRIVEEYETANGKPTEISKNYFAFCKETNSVYYFGEDVNIYKDGKLVSHDGAWIAEGPNKPGLAMPGIILMGAKFDEEIAPGIAMDQAEIISVSETVKTHKGYFVDCLKVEETNSLKPKEKEYKFYAKEVGLIKDEELVLVKYGFIK